MCVTGETLQTHTELIQQVCNQQDALIEMEICLSSCCHSGLVAQYNAFFCELWIRIV